MDKTISLVLGDCRKSLKETPDNSVDLMATDPPYGYSFMGKDWDKVVVGVDVWRECLRVLKPGTFAFVMCAPRQDVLCKQITALGEAGFNTGFTSIYWTYASGFPKAGNIGKMADKRFGNKRIAVKGRRASTMGSNTMNGGKANPGYQHTKGVSPLEGSYAGFQPKPAVEIILVCMKPLSEKGYLDQALKNRKGVTWLDDCRVPYKGEKDIGDPDRGKGYPMLDEKKGWNKNKIVNSVTIGEKGRFSANLLVSDDVLNDGKITKSSPVGHKNIGWKHSGNTSDKMTPLKYQQEFNDSGSFSRYFSLDAWWAEKIKDLPESARRTFPFLIIPKASKSEKNQGLTETRTRECRWNNAGEWKNLKTKYKNVHPTVKPLKLFSYLIILGSRPGDMIMDPFMGSGTAGMAAKLLNRKFMGVELNKEYFGIAEQRIKCTQRNLL